MAFDPDWFFADPILVGIEDSSGLTAVHFVDDNCTALVGQPHDHDTAHDFTWGWSVLESGQKGPCPRRRVDYSAAGNP